MRAVILFLAAVVAASAVCADASTLFDRIPQLASSGVMARAAICLAIYAVVVAILWFYGRLGSRVAGHPAWFVVLVALAAVQLFVTPLVAPALMLAVWLVLLRSTPRVGTIYEASSFPAVRAFLAFTLLLVMSTPRIDSRVFDVLWRFVARVDPAFIVYSIAAAIAAILIVGAGLRHRRVQPCGAAPWLTAGLIVGVMAEAVRLAPPSAGFVAQAVLPLRLIAHLVLFVGVFLLLSHLLPPRAADEVRFNP